MGIRNSAKALLISNGKILLNKNQNSVGDIAYGLPNGAIYYDLPGGGQNQYETLEEAVKRECLEEAGYAVAVDRLVAVYEEITMHEELRVQYEQYAHKVQFLFVCHLLDEAEPAKPATEKDLDMLESVWIDIADVRNLPLYPQVINANLEALLKSETVVFLGSERI